MQQDRIKWYTWQFRLSFGGCVVKNGVKRVGLAGGFCLVLLPAFAHADGKGWFSGINAPQQGFAMEMNTNPGLEGEVLSTITNGPPSLYTESGATPFVPRNLTVGGAGTWLLDDHWGVVGSLSTVRTQNALNNGNPLTGGLADSMPFNAMGLGLKYDLTRSLRFQGGWDRYQFSYDRINGDANVDLFSIGLRYGF